MGLMGNDMMYLAGDGGYGQGINAFANNFLNAWKTVGEEKRADEYRKMQEMVMAAQIAKMQREEAQQQEIANIFKPQTIALMQNGEPTAVGNKMLQGMIGNIPATTQVMRPTASTEAPSIGKGLLSQNFSGGEEPSIFTGAGNLAPTTTENPDYVKARQDALAKLTEQGSISVPRKLTMDDLIRVSVLGGKGADIAKAFIEAQTKAGDVPSSKWKAFAMGYKEKLLKDNPNLSEGEVNYLTAQEADRLGIDKNITQFIQKSEAQDKINSQKGFASWTPQAKSQAFMTDIITGQPPVSVRGFAVGDRQTYAKEFSQWQVDNGIKPQDIALMKADYKAGDMSLKNMKKQEAPMQAFVGNINQQMDKLQQLINDADRSGFRLADLTWREIKTKALGSGKEAAIASYLLEISNEIGKLSSGASASIQQLSDSAKEDWKKVHDPNLSPKELMYVLNTTREQANMRMSTWKQAGELVRDQIKGIGASTKGTTADRFNNPFGLTRGKLTQDTGTPSGVINKEGAEWMSYSSLEEGEQAARQLWQAATYQNKTVDAALRQWSNNGYNGNIVPDLKNKMVRDLSPGEFNRMFDAQRKRETGGNNVSTTASNETPEHITKLVPYISSYMNKYKGKYSENALQEALLKELRKTWPDSKIKAAWLAYKGG